MFVDTFSFVVFAVTSMDSDVQYMRGMNIPFVTEVSIFVIEHC